MSDEKEKHTPESVATKIVKAPLKYTPSEQSERKLIPKKRARQDEAESYT
jgi:hypothetical protein